jgi:SPP1 family phage portal protein
MAIYTEAVPGNKEFSAYITGLIKAKNERDILMGKRYQRYLGSQEGVPIYTRRQPSYLDKAERPDMKIPNDFFGEVIDVKAGYIAGVPIQYGYQTNKDEEPQIDEHGIRELTKEEEFIADFMKRSMVEDLDAETVKMCAMCGISGRLLYIDTDGEESAINLNPWEFAIIQNPSKTDTIAAIRYYTETEYDEKGASSKVQIVEFYSKQKVWYLKKSKNGTYNKNTAYDVNPKEHMFEQVPVLLFKNNEELQGDCEKVLDLIDAYNEAISDQASEHAAFRTAYMIVEGATVDTALIAKLKTTGAIQVPVGGRVSWLTKDVSIEATQDLKEDLKKNICRFAKSVDFTDQNLYGNMTKMVIHMRLFALESKSATFERKMVGTLRAMFRVLGTAWKKKQLSDYDYMRMTFKFIRNLPSNLSDEAPNLKMLIDSGVPKELAFAQMSFIKDPKAAVIMGQKEELERLGISGLDNNGDDDHGDDDHGDRGA